MQTFLPYPGFLDSAGVLDDRRLGKQRVETFQILRALTWPSYGWKNHPAVRMWRGFTAALVCYGLACCDEWAGRGYADATRTALLEFTGGRSPRWEELVGRGQLPPWLGREPVHVSHQSALVRKNPEIYRAAFPDVPDDLPYVWPAASFPRWPVRRGRAEPLELHEALALLGLEQEREPQRQAVEAAAAGRSLTLTLPAGGGATTAGLLAGLCSAGSTLWVTPGPVLPSSQQRPPAPTPPVRTPGKLSASIARPPTAEAAAAMAAEAWAEPEFAFLRPEHLSAESTAGVGLVVLEGELGAYPGLPAGLRVPVLRLLPSQRS